MSGIIDLYIQNFFHHDLLRILKVPKFNISGCHHRITVDDDPVDHVIPLSHRRSFPDRSMERFCDLCPYLDLLIVSQQNTERVLSAFSVPISTLTLYPTPFSTGTAVSSRVPFSLSPYTQSFYPRMSQVSAHPATYRSCGAATRSPEAPL